MAILNYALTLEYLETAFYRQARANAGLKGETATFAAVAGAHEAAHVDGPQAGAGLQGRRSRRRSTSAPP